MDPNDTAALKALIWIAMLAGPVLLRWCARTEQDLVEHLGRQLHEETGVDAAYTCAPSGKEKILVGVRKQ